MSAGALIEDGTHQELINADGAYAKLVKAQKLREENLDDENEIDPDAPHIIAGESITGAVPGSLTTDQLEKIKEDDVPLGLIKTSDSSAPPPGREVASKSRRMRGVADSEYSVSTLFKRMGAMNTDGYRAYAAGALGATGESAPRLRSVECLAGLICRISF
jgi:ATP-binding cassette subfamily B (MDR/TAP) protein 1